MDEEEIAPTDPVEPSPTEPTENTEIDYPTNEDLLPTDDATNLLDPELIGEIIDKRTLIGTTLNYVFGNFEVMVFIVSIMVLTAVLIITTDFMRWKGRE